MKTIKDLKPLLNINRNLFSATLRVGESQVAPATGKYVIFGHFFIIYQRQMYF